MTTKPRVIVPNHFYEIYSEGVFTDKIFPNDQMKAFFLKQLSDSLQKYSFKCFSWSIMDNHYHLIVKSSSSTISIFMQRLNSIYAKTFNKKSPQRSGVVFSKRFTSIVIQEGEKLKEIIREIHLDPVRSGDCTLEDLDSYKWSGHHEVVNDTLNGIINKTDVLELFSNSGQITEYREYITAPCKEISQAVELVKLSNKGSLSFRESNCFVIGDNEFTKEVIDQNQSRRVRLARFVRECLTLDCVLRKVRYGVEFKWESIKKRGKMNELSTARQLFALIAHREYEFTCTKIAEYLNITTSAVSMLISRCEKIKQLSLLKEMIGC